MISNNSSSSVRIGLVIAAILVASNSGAKVGTVAFVLGSAHLEKTPSVQLVKKAPVDNGDAVVTGDNGRVQLRMVDGGKIAVRPNSVFQIENYSVTADVIETSVVATTNQQENAAVLNLLKGGFRTITGDAAGRSPESYRVKTPVATMGIRGTHYQVRLCSAACASELPPGANDSYRGPGLYVAVYEGRVWVETSGGRLEISSGEFLWVASLDDAPVLLQRPSVVLYDEPAPVRRRPRERTVDRRTVRETNLRRRPRDNFQPRNFDNRPPEEESPELPVLPEEVLQRSITWSYGPNDLTGSPTATVNADNEVTQFAVDGNGDLVRFEGQIATATGSQPATFELGSAAVVNTGQDPATGLRWGRWTNGIANVTSAGNTSGQDLGQSSLHWITSPVTNQAPAIPQSGTASYQLVGNTNPTDDVGNVGFVGSATLQANFTTQTVNSTVDLGIAGNAWEATGQGQLNNHLFGGQYNSVLINGQSIGNGEFSGFLLPVDPAVNGTLPAGGGLSYSLNNPNSGRSVSGTAAFGNPQ